MGLATAAMIDHVSCDERDAPPPPVSVLHEAIAAEKADSLDRHRGRTHAPSPMRPDRPPWASLSPAAASVRLRRYWRLGRGLEDFHDDHAATVTSTSE